jgi:transcriptional regulator with XRE-family HTH domain
MQKQDFGKILGAILHQRRVELQLTQERLAKKAGLHRTYISLLETGKQSPTAATLFQVCRRLRMRPSDVFKQLEDRLDWIVLIG